MHLDIEQYPAIKAHLANYLPAIKQSGEKGCRKKTSNAWFKTQDNIAYYEEFEKEKLVWGNISSESRFCYDKNSMYVNAPANILTHKKNDNEELKYILAILNSKVFNFQFINSGITLGAAFEWKRQYVEPLKIPIPKPSKSTLPAKVDKLLALKSCEANEANEERRK